jgi:hypothetical protein
MAKSTAADGLSERIETLIRVATPLLDLIIAGPFRKYTLHNPGHAKKLVHLAEHLMDQRTVSALSAIECAMIICAAYLHDLGMCLTSTERERILCLPEFEDSMRDWPELWDRLQLTRSRSEATTGVDRLLFEAELFQLQEVALSAYLRPRHASLERYKDLTTLLKAESNRSDLFEFNGIDFEQILIDICISHNEDVAVLAEVSGPYDARFPRDMIVGGQRLNAQFCAAILRLSDIIDFDRERTPRILFQSLGAYPNNPAER